MGLLALLCLAASASADTLVLKNGTSLEWKSLTDTGDAYEVLTVQGARVTVRKDEVEKFVQTKPQPALTGATLTFDKTKKLETVDLLKTIDLKTGIFSESARFQGGALVLSNRGAGHGNALFGYTPVPEEYDLTVTLERREGTDDIAVGLIGGGRQFGFILDGGQTWTGIHRLDGQKVNATGQGIQGKFFENGKPRTILFLVRKEAFVVRVDGKDFYTWKAEWPKVSLDQGHVVPRKDVLFLSVYRSTYVISRAVLSFPK